MTVDKTPVLCGWSFSQDKYTVSMTSHVKAVDSSSGCIFDQFSDTDGDSGDEE